jgi:glycosyltransferase involved in cell wall biosynthesis
VDEEDSARPLRVLYLSWRDRDNPEAGGAETFTERTAEVMANRGHDVTLFAAKFPGAKKIDWHGPVRVVRAGNRFLCYPMGLLHLLRNRQHYDVIVDIQNGVPFWSPLVTRRPIVNVMHHVHKDQWSSIFGPRLARFGWMLESQIAPRVYRSAQYITVSKATRDEMSKVGVDPQRVEVIYSGNDRPADLETYSSLPKTDHPSLTVLGRLVPHKHNETAIDILAELSEQFPDLELNVIGSGYWRDELIAHATERGVLDRVHFHGFVSEDTKHRLLAQSWVVLMPSQKEGWGLTIVEAGLHATPSVAFAHAGGVTESILDAETGLLAKDHAEMTSHVATLLEDEALRLKYGDNARRHALSFDWEHTGRAVEGVLQRVVSGRR